MKWAVIAWRQQVKNANETWILYVCFALFFETAFLSLHSADQGGLKLRDLSVSASGSAGTKGTTPILGYIFLDWKGTREIFLHPLQKEIVSHTFHLLGVHLCLTSPSLKCKFSLWTCKPHSHLIANYFGVLEYDQHLTDIGNLGMNKQFRVENGKFGWNRASG